MPFLYSASPHGGIKQCLAVVSQVKAFLPFKRTSASHNHLSAIVEQATHLANISLLFAGQPILSSVLSHTVEYDEESGHLSKLGIDESTISPESRIPRFTNAIWKYKSGAVGSLSHSVALHGTTYDTELVIICDGNILKLVDLYTDTPRLIIMGDGKAEPSEPFPAPSDSFLRAHTLTEMDYSRSYHQNRE